MEKQNAKVPAQIFYARHMQQGVAQYDDEMILVTEDAIKNMMPSFNGKPVYVYHVDDVDLENTHGYVTDTFYNGLDGWVWSKIIVTDEVALDAIAKGWAVSNAYIPTEYAKGGTHHNVAYDRKILNGDYTHLAIVDNPRYEDACIMSPDDYKAYCMSKKAHLDELKNSKNDKEKENFIMSFFRRKKKEEGDVFLEIKNDKGDAEAVNVTEIIRDEVDAILNAKKNESKDEDEKMNMDATVDVDGEKMSVKELINRYSKSMKNEADDEKENSEDEKENSDDEKENSEDEDEKENESDDEKKNSHFEELKNANKTPAQPAKTYMSFQDRRELANSKY